MTLKLLHEEYVERCNEQGLLPMGKTKFNEGYSEYTITNQLTNHIEHKPGVAVEVDWSGKTMHYVDISTGEIITVYLFVGTLPYSQYSYVEPTLNMKMDTFLRCHVRMYEYFGGVPTRTKCDNLKTGVVKHPKEGEIILTRDYEALGSQHNKFPDYMTNKYSTHQEDMPPAFQNITPWDDERIRSWAKSIGKSTNEVIERIFGSVSIKEQGYNPCLAILRLSRSYSDARLETACTNRSTTKRFAA